MSISTVEGAIRHARAVVSRVNYICRLASISFAGSPPRLGRVAGSVGPVAGDVKLQDDGVASGWMSRAARRCTTAAEESCTTRTMRNN